MTKTLPISRPSLLRAFATLKNRVLPRLASNARLGMSVRYCSTGRIWDGATPVNWLPMLTQQQSMADRLRLPEELNSGTECQGMDEKRQRKGCAWKHSTKRKSTKAKIHITIIVMKHLYSATENRGAPDPGQCLH